MTKETQNTNAAEKEDKRPDFIVRQYRYIRLEDGMKLRKETIGVCWLNHENGSITFRPNGRQIIEQDLYLFPTENKDAQ